MFSLYLKVCGSVLGHGWTLGVYVETLSLALTTSLSWKNQPIWEWPPQHKGVAGGQGFVSSII